MDRAFSELRELLSGLAEEVVDHFRRSGILAGRRSLLTYTSDTEQGWKPDRVWAQIPIVYSTTRATPAGEVTRWGTNSMWRLPWTTCRQTPYRQAHQRGLLRIARVMWGHRLFDPSERPSDAFSARSPARLFSDWGKVSTKALSDVIREVEAAENTPRRADSRRGQLWTRGSRAS